MDKEKFLLDFKKELDKTITISDSEWDFLKLIFVIKEYKRKDILIEFNEIANPVFLIAEGSLQLFHISNNKEYTIDFFSPPSVVASLESFIHRTPSKLCLKAVTDVTVLVANYDIISEAYMHFPFVQKLSRYFTESSLIKRLRSELYHNTLNAKEKYFHLFEKHPNLISNLTQKQIASYIGIAPESLYRIKRTLKNDINKTSPKLNKSI